MALKKCKECGNEISSKAKTCPNCGSDQRNFFMRHKILSIVLTLIGLILILSIGNEPSSPPTIKSSSQEPQKAYANIGDTVVTDEFEIKINLVEKRNRVGEDIFLSEPLPGGTYVCIQWQYKNIFDKPISSGNFPYLKLVDPQSVVYDIKYAASASYASEIGTEKNVWSDLSPGITATDVDVFEVGDELYGDGTGWSILINADKEAYVKIK